MHITIKGRAGKNAETKGDYTFASVAVYNGKKDGQNVTEWISIRAKQGGWAGDMVSRVEKGQIVHATGRLSVDRYTDKEGKDQVRLSIWVDQCDSYTVQRDAYAGKTSRAPEGVDDDIPF